jgi:hypothetical protein
MDTEEEQELEAFLRRMHGRFPLDADALLDQAAGNLRDAERLGEELLERRKKEAREIVHDNHRSRTEEGLAQAEGGLPRSSTQMNHKTSSSQRDYSAASPDETNLITVVYGLPNPEVACHAIAPTQLLAASATVLQRVEGMGNIRGNNSPLNLIIQGILSVTNPSVDFRKEGVQRLSDAHRMLSPDQAERQDDAGDFLDKAMLTLGFEAPKLRKMCTCTSCSHETIDENDVHGFHSAVWHIQATDKSVEEGIRRALRFDADKHCSECGKNTVHDVIIKVQKPQTLPVIAIVIDRVGTGGTVNHRRVSFPLTLRGVGLGGNRRLVGICSHFGESNHYGHYVAIARRFLHVERLEHDRSETISVPTGTFLRFDDGKVPRPVSLKDIADEEKTTLLLYEIAPDGYEIEENVPFDRPTLPEVCTFTPRHPKVDREASNEDIPSAKERIEVACRECKSYDRNRCRHCSICESPYHDKRTHDKSGHDSSIDIILNRLQPLHTPLQTPLQPPPPPTVSAHSPSIKSDSKSSADDHCAEGISSDHSAEIAHLYELLEEQSRKHAAEIARLEQKIASITVSDRPVAGEDVT